MDAPPKPWEQNRNSGRNLNSSAPMTNTMNGLGVGRSRVMSSGTGVPQVPPRPRQTGLGGLGNSYGMGYGGASYGMMGRQYGGYAPYSSYNSYGGYGGGYGGMGGGMLGGYGGAYGGYGMGGMGAESRFIQLAEESTRPAFQGIESLVRAFGSIAMMLDSTFFAVTSSFRAVLGVAENFGRIRSMFAQIWSSFALIRGLNWLYKKLLSMLGLRGAEEMGKDAWNQAASEIAAEGVQNVSSWPIFMFLGMIITAPYFISRLLPPIIDKRDPANWPSPGVPVQVMYPFQAANEQELSIQPGESVRVAPKEILNEMNASNTGWVLAASNRGSGLIPLSYVQPLHLMRSNPAEPIINTPMMPNPEPNTHMTTPISSDTTNPTIPQDVTSHSVLETIEEKPQ